MEQRRAQVGLLGISAARQLGFTNVDNQPVVYLADIPITIIGIISDIQMSAEDLSAVVVPTT